MDFILGILGGWGGGVVVVEGLKIRKDYALLCFLKDNYSCRVNNRLGRLKSRR